MISWLREDPRYEHAGDWAGAHSLVAELAIDSGGRIAAAPHPNLLRSGVFARHTPVTWPWAHDLDGEAPPRPRPRTGPSAPAVHGTAGAPAPVAIHVTAGAPVAIDLRRSDRPVARIARSFAGNGLVVERPGHDPDLIPFLDPTAPVELFVDADILEIFSGGVYGAWRLGSAD